MAFLHIKDIVVKCVNNTPKRPSYQTFSETSLAGLLTYPASWVCSNHVIFVSIAAKLLNAAFWVYKGWYNRKKSVIPA